MSNVVRLISASKRDFETMTPMDLKESIYKSEGRVIMGQHLLFAGAGLVRGVTNSELMFAFGSDMVLLNTIPEVANTPSHKIKFLDVAPVFARAIGHIHGATSIADLF